MSFLRRLLSGEYRRAVAAEAAGDHLEAARRYALAGDRAKVAEMHLRRAEAASTHAEEIAALRDALAFADEATAPRRQAARGLARALRARARAEGVATERDREAVREAARLLEEVGDFTDAGAAWEQLEEHGAAAAAYERGGLLDLMEVALAKDDRAARRERRRRQAFEEHEQLWKSGDREAALAALRSCADLAADCGDADAGEVRRLLGRLEARRLAAGVVTLRRRAGGALAVLRGDGRATIGRDAPCDLVVRAASVSREHAEVAATAAPGGATFTLRDAGSRHGTWIGGLPVTGQVPLQGEGRFGLGPDCEIAYREEGGALRLEVARGLGPGGALIVAPAGAELDLEPACGLRLVLRFREGRPTVEPRPGETLQLNGAPIARGAAQLVREDVLAVGDVEAEVV